MTTVAPGSLLSKLDEIDTNTTGVVGGDASAANQTAVQADAGNDASKALAIQGITGGKVISVEITPQLEAHTSAAAASLVAKASAGVIYSVSGYNAKTSAQYIQVHNTSSLPADSVNPVKSFKVEASSQFSFDFAGIAGVTMSTGITVCNSSTLDTKTIGSADCRFEVGYK